MKIRHLFGIGKTKIEKMLDEWVDLRDRLDLAEAKTEKRLEKILENTARVKTNTELFEKSLKESKASIESQKKTLSEIKKNYLAEGKTPEEIQSLMSFQLETYNSAKAFATELEKQKPLIDANLKEAEKSLSEAVAYKSAVKQRKALLETQISTYEINKDLFEMTGKPLGNDKLIEDVEKLLNEKTIKLDSERWVAEKVKAAEAVVNPPKAVSFNVKEAYDEI